MELVKSVVGQRNRWSHTLHIALYIAYALLIFVLISPGVDLPLVALLLVIISKWRVVAVRPRFWLANFQANFVDFMVGISVWALMILTAVATPWVSAMLAVLYVGWSVVIKPHSTQKWVLAQAGIGLFMSLTALFSYAHLFEFGQIVKDSSLLTVITAWVIGYMTARHALTAYHNEDERTFLSLVWAFVTAELVWLFHHWTIAYSIYRTETVDSDQLLMIPQAVIVIVLLGYLAIKVYEMLHHPDSKKAQREVKPALIFIISIVTILLLFFNGSIDITAL